MSDDFQIRLRTRIAEVQSNPRRISLEAGLSADTVGKMLKPNARLPRGDSLVALSRALRVNQQWLTTGDGPKEAAPEAPPPGDRDGHIGEDTVEIKAVAAGSHDIGAFQIIDNRLGWAPLPRGLAGQTDLYALLIINDSMWPEHKPGAIRYATPSITPRIGDSVVIEFNRDVEVGPEAMIGHLKGRGENVRIGKLNPAATIEIPASSVIRLHRLASESETR